MGDLRKQCQIELCGSDVSLNVDMRLIELIERIYDSNVDVVAVMLTDPRRIKLTQIADVYLAWLTPGQLDSLGTNRADIREYIYKASMDEINKLVGCIQASCLYFRNQISAEDFDTLTRGESLPDEVDAKKPGSEGDGQPNSTDSLSED
jgi:hypothetical protein